MSRPNERNEGYSTSFDYIDDCRGVTDDEVNSAYNYFSAESMKFYRGIYVKLDRNFRGRKDSHKSEWNDFKSVVKLCKDNGFQLKCYIKYCFLNRLVKKNRGHAISDISYLRNYPSILDYAKNKREIERLYSIYMSIRRTAFAVKKMSDGSTNGIKSTLKSVISSGKLMEFISTGSISPYFLALMPRAEFVIHKNASETEDRAMLGDLCSRIKRIASDAVSSLKMFYPDAMGKTVVELCC